MVVIFKQESNELFSIDHPDIFRTHPGFFYCVFCKTT